MLGEMSSKAIIYFVLSLSLIVIFIGLLWFLLWKFILEPNPVIRDFFDLDLKKPQKVE